ncbi:hypothetical protein PPL_01181 [Heterostelium album PN500]|uniref:Uncharacterized protein n=1 Tax=Heterostelium pallidum (strain ATCC 26659 / Pp 5 / PN500) TaxID=670386 RepID=D3AYC1_HETP5|nr:hypothetical protein PPL_01181 [Heterostelium album PN500]EFA85948.1 hypothetical protein PPL_01181 [Heterostelium album PN500]|eukprot:XP_020438054.1 hypothetical protein PPL_01181 [Heterostelium album PN500]
MIIINKPSNADEDEQKRWCILEFQGCFEDSTPSKLSNEVLGELIHKEKDIYQLQIGNQMFEGKDIKLKNPLLVIRKVSTGPNNNNGNSNGSSSTDDKDSSNNNITEYEVNTLIYSKICFTNRPSTIIAQQSVKYGSPQHRKSPSSSPSSSPMSTTPEKIDMATVSPMKSSPIQQPKFTQD